MLETMPKKLVALGEIKAVIKVLKHRFGNISEDLETKLLSLSSIETVDTLVDLSVTSTSLEEFQAKMDIC